MTTDTDADARRAWISTLYADDPAARGQGIVVEWAEGFRSRLTMRVREDMVNSHRICHGGLIFMLGDTAFAYAANTGPDRLAVTSSATIMFSAPARFGDVLVAESELTATAGRVGVYRTVITAGDRTVALLQGQMVTTPAPPPGPAADAGLGGAPT